MRGNDGSIGNAASNDRPAEKAGFPLLAAVFMLSASGLMFELTLTRIFSATIWYHFTFVAISVALFGWGLGGFTVCLLRASRFQRHMGVVLVCLSLALAVTLPVFLLVILSLGFTPDMLAGYFVASLVPFFVGGALLSLAFESAGRDSNRLYFADLIGAALGTVLVPLVIHALGAETTLLAIAILPALAAVCLSLGMSGGRRLRWVPVSAAFVALAAGSVFWNLETQTLTVRDAPEKELYQLLKAHPDARIDSDEWNAYSRITRVSNFSEKHLARLFIDSSAETSVMHWTGKPGEPAGADGWFRAFPFRMKKNAEVLVIGPGGGTDVVAAIATGATRVTAVEMNPLVVQAVRDLGAAAGNLYDHPQVELVMEEGRNYIGRSDRRFDVIVLGWVDSWASVASGGLALTENYLYTREALKGYFELLNDDERFLLFVFHGEGGSATRTQVGIAAFDRPLDVVRVVNVAFRGESATTDAGCGMNRSDINCDGVASVLDVVGFVNVAFRGAAAITDPNPTCPWQSTDVNCSGSTDVPYSIAAVNIAQKVFSPI